MNNWCSLFQCLQPSFTSLFLQFGNDPLNTCSKKPFCTVTTPNNSEKYSNPSRLHRRGKKTTATLIAQVTRATHFLLLQIIIIASLLYFCILIYHFLFLFFPLLLPPPLHLTPFGIKNQLLERKESNRRSGYWTSLTQKKLFNLKRSGNSWSANDRFGPNTWQEKFLWFGKWMLDECFSFWKSLIRKQFSV